MANVYTLPFKQQQLKYMHQAFFNPLIHTLITAINNGHLENIPFMKADLIRKYLTPSSATSKGCMKRPRMGIHSVRKQRNNGSTTTPVEPVSPTEGDGNSNVNQDRVISPTRVNVIPIGDNDESACKLFCYAALANKHTGAMYTDATGALPVLSVNGHQYYFVAYAYDINYIFAIPIQNVQDVTIMEAFDEVFQELKAKGFKPTFNVADNQATVPIKAS